MRWERGIVCVVLTVVCLSVLPGCATIASQKKYTVTIDNPGGPTHFAVRDKKKNVLIHQGTTPQQVTLDAKSYPFWPAQYDVAFTGHSDKTQHYELKAGFDPWFAGNIVLGGIAGAVVDGFTGAMYKLPKRISGGIPAQYAMSDTSQGAQVIAADSNSNTAPRPANDVQQAGHQQTTQ